MNTSRQRPVVAASPLRRLAGKRPFKVDGNVESHWMAAEVSQEFSSGSPGHPDGATLRVRVRMPPGKRGDVLLAVFNSPQSWMTMDAVAFKAAQPCPGDGLALIELQAVPAGTYACCVLIDSNGNHQMDFNIAGFPIEDFAFSNQAIGSYGPPSFEKASFVLDGKVDQEIEILID